MLRLLLRVPSLHRSGRAQESVEHHRQLDRRHRPGGPAGCTLEQRALAPHVVPVRIGVAASLDLECERRALLDHLGQPCVEVVDAVPDLLDAPGRCRLWRWSRLLLRIGRSDELEAAKLVHERAEVLEAQALVAVGPRVGRIGMDLDDQAVGADGGARQGHRRNERSVAGAVAGVDHDRQVRPGAEDRHGRQVERVAGRGLEGADAALAQDHVRVAGRQDVLGRQQPLLDRRAQAALEEDRPAALPDGLEQHEVRHVARADLEDVDVLLEDRHVGRVDHLADDGQAERVVCLVQELEGGQAEALERVRRGARLEGAAAQDAGALALDGAGRLHELLARLDRARAGHHHELLAEAQLHAVDPHPGPLRLVLRARELVGRADPDDLLDARQRAEVRDTLDVAADDADHGPLLAHAEERLEPVLLDGASDPVDLLVRRRRTHHHDHRFLPRLSLPAPIRIGETKNAGAFASCVCGHECLRRRDLLACLVPASRKTTAVSLDGGA